MNNIPSITKNLLIINVLAFFATWVFEKQGLDLTATFGLHFFMAKDFSFYQLVTYLFMHGSFMHLFFNMFAVWMFGTVMERVWGPKRFLIYYLVCGIGAGIIQEGVQYINYANENLAAYDFVMTSSGRITTEAYLNLWTTVGASGAVYAILLAFGMTFPNERMFIIPFPFPIKAKWLIGGYIVIEVWSALNTPGDGIAHMAHLGDSGTAISDMAQTYPMVNTMKNISRREHLSKIKMEDGYHAKGYSTIGGILNIVWLCWSRDWDDTDFEDFDDLLALCQASVKINIGSIRGLLKTDSNLPFNAEEMRKEGQQEWKEIIKEWKDSPFTKIYTPQRGGMI